jgi:hypothetical protein
MLRKAKNWFVRTFLGESPTCTYRCSMSGATYCMHKLGSGFVVEKTQVVEDMTVAKRICLVEAGGSEHDLAHRFLEIIERDAVACTCVRKAA